MATRIPEPHLDAWRALLNAHAALTESVERALREAGLPPLAWYDVLWALRRAPDWRLRMGELAANVTLSRGGLTKLVDRLEAAELLRREPCASDRRGFHAVLTDAGATMLRRIWPIYAAVLEEELVSALSENEAAALADALRRLSRGPAVATAAVV
ncbi:MAG: MarR family winged helix-turn-helix transcriptional regulator [Gaiellaceae bacterium]